MKKEEVLKMIDQWKAKSDASTTPFSEYVSYMSPKEVIRDFIIIKEELWRAVRVIYPDNHKRDDPIDLTRAIDWINSIVHEIMQREDYTKEEIEEYFESIK